MATTTFRWRRRESIRTDEPSHVVGSISLYGTGADVVPIDNWQHDDPDFRAHFRVPPGARYHCEAWYKWGHLTREKTTSFCAKTVDEGKRRCEAWLLKITRRKDEGDRHGHRRPKIEP